MHIKLFNMIVMRKLKHIFNYIFYMAYAKEEKSWASVPVLQGLLSLSLIINLYLLIAFILIEMFFKVPIFSLPKEELFPYIILIATIVLIINYFIYGYKNKFAVIIDKYKTESEENKKKNRLTTRVFIILSIVLLIIVFIIGVS